MNSSDTLYPDIYFEPAYGRLYETPEETCEQFLYETDAGRISDVFLKRRIPDLPEGEEAFDLITPYGYGGPVILELKDPEKKKELIDGFMQAFSRYAKENRIVSEFVRFHPIIGNGVDFREAYGSLYDRKTVGTNLTYEDVIGTEFSKHKRKDIRKILSDPLIRYETEEAPDRLDDFLEIYYSTMDRDAADDYYYFGRDYFQKILDSFPENVVTCRVFYGEKTIAMGVYFRYKGLLHAHLSGTLTEYLSHSPAYILKYAMALYGHEKGYQYIHYGGGTSSSPDNSLYQFKKNFGKNTEFDFYIGKKIWDEAAYHRLCALRGVPEDTAFFPAYRAKG